MKRLLDLTNREEDEIIRLTIHNAPNSLIAKRINTTMKIVKSVQDYHTPISDELKRVWHKIKNEKGVELV